MAAAQGCSRVVALGALKQRSYQEETGGRRTRRNHEDDLVGGRGKRCILGRKGMVSWRSRWRRSLSSLGITSGHMVPQGVWE